MSGARQGRLLHMLARMAGARRILEIGTFTGYATVWLAAAVGEAGTVVSLERDPRAAEVCRRHLQLSGLDTRVRLEVGDALETIISLPPSEPPFDLVFIDADKKRYITYYEELLGRSLLSSDGLIIADNILWKGQVLEKYALDTLGQRSGEPNNAATKAQSSRERRLTALRDAMDGFNRHVGSDARTVQLIVPLRDGLSFAQKALGGDQVSAVVPTPALVEDSHDHGISSSVKTRRDELHGGGKVEGVGSSGAGGHWPGWSTSVDILQSYLNAVCNGEPSAMRSARIDSGANINGHRYGWLLHMLGRMTPTRRVLEVGSQSGYTTMWLASAVGETGRIVTIEQDVQAAELCTAHLKAAGLEARVQVVSGSGALLETIESFPADSAAKYDLVVLNGKVFDECSLSEMYVLGCAASRWLNEDGLLLARVAPGVRPLPLIGRAGDVDSDMAIGAVVIPSPDGDGCSIVIYGRRSTWERAVANKAPTICQTCELCSS